MVKNSEILVGLQQPSVKRACNGFMIPETLKYAKESQRGGFLKNTFEGFIHMMELLLKSSHQILQVVSPT